MFLQWCLSYLLISVIALTLLLASGYRYLDVLRDNLEYTNGIQLDMTRVWLDQKVKPVSYTHLARAVADFDHLFGIGGIQRHWLFAKHMLTMLHGFYGNLRVQIVGQADVYNIDFRVIQYLSLIHILRSPPQISRAGPRMARQSGVSSAMRTLRLNSI